MLQTDDRQTDRRTEDDIRSLIISVSGGLDYTELVSNYQEYSKVLYCIASYISSHADASLRQS